MLLAEGAAAQTLPVERFAEAPDLKIVTPAGADSFGRTVARLGDINGDGFEEFVVASGFANNSRGRVWVYFGPGATTSPAFIFDGEADGDFFGGTGDSSAVDAGGDFNGDGVPDIIIGAQRNDGATGDPNDNRGATYVYSGADGSLLVKWTGAMPGDAAGTRVRFFADVDAIPGDEVITTNKNIGTVMKTEVRSSDPMKAMPLFVVTGFAASSAGFIDQSDTVTDLAVGAPLDSAGGPAAGTIEYISSLTGFTIPAPDGPFGDTGEHLGTEVAFVGDVNGDTRGDIAAAGVNFDNNRGRVRVISGAGLDHPTLFGWPVDGENPGDAFGWSVRSAGDVDGDGVEDVAVGAPNFDRVTPGGVVTILSGRAYLYSGADGSLIARFTGEASIGDLFGRSVATADVNGDGTRDMIVAAPGNGTGAVYVFFMPPPPPPCPEDLNNDGVVDGGDIAVILNNFGPCPPTPCCPCLGDLSGDGQVDSFDIAFVLNAFGPCPSAGQQSATQPGASGWANGVAELLGGFGFSSAEAYAAWLESLDDEALHNHILDLLKAVQSRQP